MDLHPEKKMRRLPIPFEVTESGVRWGSEVRPTPKWKHPFLALSRSLRYSLGRLLLEECYSFCLRIRARTRNPEMMFVAIVPPYPQRYPEMVNFLSGHKYLHACSAHTKELTEEAPWVTNLDVQAALKSWSAGFEFAAHIFYSGTQSNCSSSKSLGC